MNTVRYLGKATTRPLLRPGRHRDGILRRACWSANRGQASASAEDGEYHMRLVLAGERVEFATNASVSSAMPTTLRGSSAQQARWEHGRLQLIRHWSPRLLLCGARQADPVQINAGLECLVRTAIADHRRQRSLDARRPDPRLAPPGGAGGPHPRCSMRLRARRPAADSRARPGLPRFAGGTRPDRKQGCPLRATGERARTASLDADRARGAPTVGLTR